MAAAAGLAVSTVQKIWKAHGRAPHRWRTFKLSAVPAFAEKLHAIVGLYVSPPAHAVVQRHRHQKFIRFLNEIEKAVPTGKVIYAILDNYAAHKHPKVRARLDRHPRWVFHSTPTSSSSLNAVEGSSQNSLAGASATASSARPPTFRPPSTA